MYSILERQFFKLQVLLADHIKFIRLSISGIVVIVGGLTSAEFDKVAAAFGLSSQASNLVYWAAVAFLVVIVLQFVYLLFDVLLGRRLPPPPPPETGREIRFIAQSSDIAPELSKLTAVAEREFDDTMRPEVVQSAFERRCAFGLRVKDSFGRNVGFFDFYHFRPEIMTRWIAGKIFERDITSDDLVPIDSVRQTGGAEINLAVGAIILKTGNPVHDYHLAPLLANATKQLMKRRLQDYRKVTIYASIFSRAGQRYAEIEDMRMHTPKDERGKAGEKHDVMFTSFDPTSRSDRHVAVSRQNVYILEIENDVPPR